MLLSDPFADVHSGLSKEFICLGIGLEIWVAVENLRIRERFALSILNVLVFGLFAIFATFRWLLGNATCGCAGLIQLPTWWFVILDLSLTSLFALFAWALKGNFQGLSVMNWWNRQSSSRRGIFSAVALVVFSILFLQLPATSEFRAKLFGELPLKSVSMVDGVLSLGQVSDGEVWIYNRSASPAKIVGEQRSCSCFHFKDVVGMVVPENGKQKVSMVITPNKPGVMTQRAILYLDHPEQFRLRVEVVGIVRE